MNMKVNSDNLAFKILCEYAKEGDISVAESTHQESEPVHHAYLAFRAGQKKYLIPVQDMVEVCREIQEATRLPFAPPWLLGLSAARGQVFSILDLSCLMERHNAQTPTSMNTSYVLLGGKGEGFMLRVDEILGMKGFDIPEIDKGNTPVTRVVQAENETWNLIDVGQMVSEEFLFGSQN